MVETVRDHMGKRMRSRRAPAAVSDGPRRRTDVRLAPAALLVWCAAIAGVWLTPAALVGLCCGLLILAGLLIGRTLRGRKTRSREAAVPPAAAGDAAAGESAVGRRRAVDRPGGVPRSFLITTSIALLLAVAAAAHSAVASSQRHDGPLADAVKAGTAVVIILEIAGAPRPLAAAGQSGMAGRWSVPVTTVEITAGGQVVRTRAQLVAMGGGDWGTLVTGQVVRTAGKLKAADPGQPETGILTASSAPIVISGAHGWEDGAKELRSRYVAAAAFLEPEARGLLPGMVTGDTSALDEGLETAMKAVGMTHLTAVSGANCSLVLGALLLAARSLRLPRLPAAALALSGLALFVVMVGPDASVLRAALMGSIALASLAGGRSGRGLSFLCLAVIGLLLFDPGLGTSFGFLLSVLATLGIIVLGQRMVEWTPAVIPRWVAAAVAVPLSAQLLCSPAIVLLQPQFSTYSLLANVLASPLVAPVTLLGTAAVPLVVLVPWAATVLIAVAGTFSAGVAWTARFTAALPGASLAWPEGAFGLLTMVLLSALTLGIVLLALHPRVAVDLVLGLHSSIEWILENMELSSWLPRFRGGHPVQAGGAEPWCGRTVDREFGRDPRKGPGTADWCSGAGTGKHRKTRTG